MSKISVTFLGESWGEVIEQMTAFVGGQPAPHAAPAQLHVVPNAENATFPPFTPAQTAPLEFWPVGDCPIHHKPFQDGNYGPFCSGKGGNGPLNKKGYCDLKPGAIYAGKGIPLLPVAAS